MDARSPSPTEQVTAEGGIVAAPAGREVGVATGWGPRGAGGEGRTEPGLCFPAPSVKWGHPGLCGHRCSNEVRLWVPVVFRWPLLLKSQGSVTRFLMATAIPCRDWPRRR